MAKAPSRIAAASKESPAAASYTPPANPEAEQSVLGAILVRPEVMDRVADLLTPKDFYREAHSRIYQAILDLYNRREPVDLVSVTALLKERGHLEGVGGPVFLAGLSEQVGFAANADYYARLVHDKAVLRRLLDCSQEIAGACLAPVENVEEFLDWAEHQVFQIAEAKIRLGFQPLGSLVEKEIATLEAIWHREAGRITGVPSGFKDMDNLTAGFQKSDLIIIAARPSMGKTALALNIAFHAAYEAQVPVAFFSLEMSKEQLVRRFLSCEGHIDASHLRRAFLTDQEWRGIQEAAGKLMDAPIYIDDTPAATVLEIRGKSRRLKAEGKLGLVIVDYLQLMRGRGDAPSREQEISEISRSLKALAKELAVPVIALSQLSRKVEDRDKTNKRPILSDLRESGAIEQDADVVLFIYRDEVYREDSPDKGTAEVKIGKQRNGPSGQTIKLAFQDKFTRFDNLEREKPLVTF
ncbi:MAG: replicative DNA helicase [Desulfobaccales bacterium]|nr:replicative DNA helicase [Desulfobaccales bacterium]